MASAEDSMSGTEANHLHSASMDMFSWHVVSTITGSTADGIVYMVVIDVELLDLNIYSYCMALCEWRHLLRCESIPVPDSHHCLMTAALNTTMNSIEVLLETEETTSYLIRFGLDPLRELDVLLPIDERQMRFDGVRGPIMRWWTKQSTMVIGGVLRAEFGSNYRLFRLIANTGTLTFGLQEFYSISIASPEATIGLAIGDRSDHDRTEILRVFVDDQTRNVYEFEEPGRPKRISPAPWLGSVNSQCCLVGSRLYCFVDDQRIVMRDFYVPQTVEGLDDNVALPASVLPDSQMMAVSAFELVWLTDAGTKRHLFAPPPLQFCCLRTLGASFPVMRSILNETKASALGISSTIYHRFIAPKLSAHA